MPPAPAPFSAVAMTPASVPSNPQRQHHRQNRRRDDHLDPDVAARSIAAAYLLDRPTAKYRVLASLLRSPDNRYQSACEHLTLRDCAEARRKRGLGATAADAVPRDAPGSVRAELDACDLVHFEPVVQPHTDLSYGHCSYLNTCHRTNTCKYMHFTPVRRPGAPPFVWRSRAREPAPPLPTPAEPAEAAPLSSSSPPSSSSSSTAAAAARRLEALRLFHSVPLRHPLRALRHAGLAEHWAGGGGGGGVDGVGVGPRRIEQLPPQWIDADVQTFDLGILGKFDVVIADPPWDIHMSLPYGTMSDDALRAMPFPQLQDEGYIFLWVTGRAMELGRELLDGWGYTRIDELIWVKVGQTQRLIRTGRTGHWLNHTKEHCLVGAKLRGGSGAPSTRDHPSQASSWHAAAAAATSAASAAATFPCSLPPGVAAPVPPWSHAGLDADVVVSELRHTSRKPDEVYGVAERLCPGGRKLELFGRRHNARDGWITVGNQLKGDNLVDPELKERVAAWRRRQLGQ